MKKVTSEQLVVGRTYYAHDDQTTPLTFVKYDENGCPCFTQPKGGYWREQTDGLCHFGGNPIFYEISALTLQEKGNPIFYEISALTLQEKFEQGWEIKHLDNWKVVEMHIFKNGIIATVYSEGNSACWFHSDFYVWHTITPPAPKVERRFTPITFWEDGVVLFGLDLDTLDDAKSYMPEEATTLLEHEKQGDKWVFVKAHTV